MKHGILIGSIALCAFVWTGCSSEESEEPVAGGAFVPATPEERDRLITESIEETVTGGTECLGSPLVDTCFEVLYTTCFQPEGACTEEVPTGTQNTWTWDNDARVVFDYAGIDETGSKWLSAMTGYTPEGEVCFNGVLELDGFQNTRTITIQIGDTVLERKDFNNTIGVTPYTEYICGDGSFFQVPLDDMTIADACLFGPNAKPCGFLKPVAVEIAENEE